MFNCSVLSDPHAVLLMRIPFVGASAGNRTAVFRRVFGGAGVALTLFRRYELELPTKAPQPYTGLRGLNFCLLRMIFNSQPTRQNQIKTHSIFSVSLTRSGICACRIYRTPGKINLPTTFTARMFFFEFIRENFFLMAAFRAPARKRLQVLELLESWTVLWCSHFSTPPANDSMVVMEKKFMPSCAKPKSHSAKSSEGSPGFIDGRPQLPWLHEPTEHQFPAFLIVKYVGIIFAT